MGRKIDHAIRTVAELLGIEDSATKPQDELLTGISTKDKHSHALIADYANAVNAWLW